MRQLQNLAILWDILMQPPPRLCGSSPPASGDPVLFIYFLMKPPGSFPYAGTTTTCESLYMGVPCITLAGRCHAHNVGVSLLHAVGVAEGFVARTEDEYVA